MTQPSNSAEPDSFLPLRPAVFLILLSLAEAESHGYALAKAVAERSAGSVRLATGPLYRHLKRLLEAGLVGESDWRPAPDQDDERRRYYRLTELGREVLAIEAERMAGLVEATRGLDLPKKPKEAW
jgi:DNA-binding PadR family transcriptional regulator